MQIWYTGRRAYTAEELERIYVDKAREFFAALEFLLEYADSRVQEGKKRFKPMVQGYHDPKGKLKHVELETDSDGDGGSESILRGKGFIEFSQKGIPHGSLHFPEMIKWAGHMYMHDTCAPEASHKIYIKKAMDRVRKGSDETTSCSMIEWVYRTHTYGKIVDTVMKEYDAVAHVQRVKRQTTNPVVNFARSKIIKPKHTYNPGLRQDSFSPLRLGGDNLLSPGVRVSFHEVRYTSHIWFSHMILTYDSHIWFSHIILTYDSHI